MKEGLKMYLPQRFIKSLLLLCLTILSINGATANTTISLYTPYTRIVVPPGESIEYAIDIKNSGTYIQKTDLQVTGIPQNWNYTLKAGGWDIKQIAIEPNEKQSIKLKVDIAQNTNKGTYHFSVKTNDGNELPLTVIVSKQGSLKTEFTSTQINMVGHAKSNFNFAAKLRNMTGEKQLYALQAEADQGWVVDFKNGSNQTSAVETEPNASTAITIEVKPPLNVKKGKYTIPVRAVNRETSSEIQLEVEITGTYEMELTTPTGLLSNNITAGSEKQIELLIKNTGTSELKNIKLSASKPKDWEVSFEKDQIDHIAAGEDAKLTAKIKAYDKAIPGDYMLTLSSKTAETDAKTNMRITVKTPLLTGWIGLLIIVVIIGLLVYLFRKYGRR